MNVKTKRQPECGRTRWSAVALLALSCLVVATAAQAAQLKDVRVGRHPSFTRVVFELDRPAGYRIERHEPAPGVAELVVSLSAASSATSVAVPKSLIEGLEIEPLGSRTIARIRLVRDGLRLKEMILSKPPRIVLDVLDTSAAAEMAKVPTPNVVPAPVPAPIEEPAIERAPQTSSPARPAPYSDPEVSSTASPSAITEPSVAVAEPEEIEIPSLVEEAEVAEIVEVDVFEYAEMEIDAEAIEAAAGLSDNAADEFESVVAEVARVEPAPVLLERSPASAPSTDNDSFLSFLPGGTYTAAGVGFVLLAAAGFVAMRRRSGSGGDYEEYEDYEDDEVFGGDNPFSVASSEAEGASAAPPPSDPLDEPTADASNDDALTLTGGSAGDEAMDSIPEISAPDVASAPGIGALPESPIGGASSDVTRLVHELESRFSKLETRLEEAIDARERLERQVAAQTEELRVQRAAIARTQRAVRNMGQQAVDDSATEPALKKSE